MAILFSEDEQVKTSLELVLLKNKLEDKGVISWIPYKLILRSDVKELVYEKENINQGDGDYVLSLKPIHEIENLIGGIKDFMGKEDKQMFSFEAIEPSFELILERGHKGFSVICWVDAGNVVSNHYTWDGFGVRFFTSLEKINSFVQELEREKDKLVYKDYA